MSNHLNRSLNMIVPLFSLLFFYSCTFNDKLKDSNSSDSNAAKKVCMVLDKGGKDDHSFNEAAAKGFEKALKELNLNSESKFVEPKTDSQIPQYLNNFASSGNCDLLITIGFNPSSYLKDLVEKFPQKKFAAIDVDLSSKNTKNNLRSVTFDEHEGSFIVGYIAALKSKQNKIGFIGGMDVPLIHRFEMGYEAGAKYLNPKIEITSGYIGVTPDAWNNPTKAKELALAQYNSGADIIFQVAAASGQGVFDAASDMTLNKKPKTFFAIGVDSNQNWIDPKIIITSMVKKVDMAVYSSIKDLVNNAFTTGNINYGLRNDGVEWSLDDNNRKFYSSDEIEKISKIKFNIIQGKILVPDYYKINK